jgi:hypothetical protein
MKGNQKRRGVDSDPLIEQANKGDTDARRKLRAWLRTIVKYKYGRIPRKILDELERVRRKTHFVWTYPDPETVATIEFLQGLREEMGENSAFIQMLVRDLAPGTEKIGVKKKRTSPGTKVEWRPSDIGFPSPLKRPQPHLSHYEPLNEFEGYLWELIPRLMNVEWVEKLKVCPECKKLILSGAKWGQRFCSDACNRSYYGRKPLNRVYCPELGKEISLSYCRYQIGGTFEKCEGCPNFKKVRQLK